MPNTIQSPNTVILDDELLPGEIMYDAKVMHVPSAKFADEVKCPNDECRHVFYVVTMKRGVRCPVCEVHYPHHKTYRALVKP